MVEAEKAQKWVQCRECHWTWPSASTETRPRCSKKGCNGYANALTPEQITAFNLPATGGKGFFPKPQPGQVPQAPFKAPGEVGEITPETLEINVEQIEPLPTTLPEIAKGEEKGDDEDGKTKIVDSGDLQLEQLDEKLQTGEGEQPQPAQPTSGTKNTAALMAWGAKLLLNYALDKMRKLKLSDSQKDELSKIFQEIAAEEGWEVGGGPWASLAMCVFAILVEQKRDPSKYTAAEIAKLTPAQKDELLAMLLQNSTVPSPATTAPKKSDSPEGVRGLDGY